MQSKYIKNVLNSSETTIGSVDIAIYIFWIEIIQCNNNYIIFVYLYVCKIVFISLEYSVHIAAFESRLTVDLLNWIEVVTYLFNYIHFIFIFKLQGSNVTLKLI